MSVKFEEFNSTFDLISRFDRSGKSSYSEEKCEIIKQCFLDGALKKIYRCSEIPFDQKMLSIPDDVIFEEVDVNIDNKECFLKEIKDSLIYNLYKFGNLKYGNYFLFHQENDYYYYYVKPSIKYTDGFICSAFSKEIQEYANKVNVVNNINYALKNKGIEMENNSQRKDIFSKSYLNYKGEIKAAIKSDMKHIFDFIIKFKHEVATEVEKVNFVKSLVYFKFYLKS